MRATLTSWTNLYIFLKFYSSLKVDTYASACFVAVILRPYGFTNLHSTRVYGGKSVLPWGGGLPVCWSSASQVNQALLLPLVCLFLLFIVFVYSLVESKLY